MGIWFICVTHTNQLLSRNLVDTAHGRKQYRPSPEFTLPQTPAPAWPPSRANTRHTPCYPKPRCRPQTRPVTPEQLLFFTNPYSSHQTLPDHEEENQEAFHPQQRHVSEEEADVEGGHPGQVLQGQAGSTVTGTKRLSPHLFLCIRCGHSPRHPGWTVSSQLPSPAVSSATAPSF